MNGDQAPCLWCTETLTFVAGTGWVHPDGGARVMTCGCGWKGAPIPLPTQCPKCGESTSLRDDHVAHPVLS